MVVVGVACRSLFLAFVAPSHAGFTEEGVRGKPGNEATRIVLHASSLHVCVELSPAVHQIDLDCAWLHLVGC